MYQGCFILKWVNLLNKLSERFYPEANAVSFDWIKAGPVLRKTSVFRVICVFLNPFCHWSLSVPPENRKLFIFWYFQVVWKETSGMLWLRDCLLVFSPFISSVLISRWITMKCEIYWTDLLLMNLPLIKRFNLS